MFKNITGSASISSCTFEDPSICGFQQAHDDNFDWTRASLSTASNGTGPTADHTLGSSRGEPAYTLLKDDKCWAFIFVSYKWEFTHGLSYFSYK